MSSSAFITKIKDMLIAYNTEAYTLYYFMMICAILNTLNSNILEMF